MSTLGIVALYDAGEDCGAIDRWFAVMEFNSENEGDTFGLAMGERRGPQGVCYTVNHWMEERLGECIWDGYLDGPENLAALPVPEGVRKAIHNEFDLFTATEGYQRP